MKMSKVQFGSLEGSNFSNYIIILYNIVLQNTILFNDKYVTDISHRIFICEF